VLTETRLRSHAIAGESGGALQPIFAGGSILGLDPTRLVIQSLLAIAFLIIAAMAWRGGIPILRPIMVGAVLLLSSGNFLLLLNTALTVPTLASGLDSASDAGRAAAGVQLIVTLLLTLYVVWYLNRGPARAFFRGFYLPTSDRATTQAENTDR
jgi:hypothetical protein